jgi:hypothetical protein
LRLNQTYSTHNWSGSDTHLSFPCLAV